MGRNMFSKVSGFIKQLNLEFILKTFLKLFWNISNSQLVPLLSAHTRLLLGTIWHDIVWYARVVCTLSGQKSAWLDWDKDTEFSGALQVFTKKLLQAYISTLRSNQWRSTGMFSWIYTNPLLGARWRMFDMFWFICYHSSVKRKSEIHTWKLIERRLKT